MAGRYHRLGTENELHPGGMPGCDPSRVGSAWGDWLPVVSACGLLRPQPLANSWEPAGFRSDLYIRRDGLGTGAYEYASQVSYFHRIVRGHRMERIFVIQLFEAGECHGISDGLAKSDPGILSVTVSP